MSDHILHLGRTRVVIASHFGSPVIGIGVFGQPVERVGTFDSPVAASRFVAAFKDGLTAEGIRWKEWRPGELLPDTDPAEIAAQLTIAVAEVDRLRAALRTAERGA